MSNKINIQFRSISYHIKPNIFSKERVQILKSISGEFKSGELTGIIGTSGAGKSTLLNIISGYETTGKIEGKIYINGREDMKEMQKRSCYIMQEGLMHDLLTVWESMEISVRLNLSVGKEEGERKIEEILKSLSLERCKNSLVKELSGGERRRLSIGVELVKNPAVLFLDEPTSGLDDVAAKNIVTLLSNLAHDGRTIVCTIHQPSAVILEKFDNLFCLFNGQCTYQGSVPRLLPYLEQFDPPLICPNYHNPADFLLEVCHGVYGDVSQKLVQVCNKNLTLDLPLKDLHLEDDPKLIPNATLDQQKEPIIEKVDNPNLNNLQSVVQREAMDTPKVEYKLGNCFGSTATLIKRIYLILSRDKQLTLTRIVANIILSLTIGVIFYKIGEDGKSTRDNLNYIFYTYIWIMYEACTTTAMTFTEELPILKRENFNRWYNVKSYFWAVTISGLPIQLVTMFIFISISYFMTGQPPELFRFTIFSLMCFLNCQVAQSFCTFLCIVTQVKTSVYLVLVSLYPFLTFCGFFIHVKDSPYFLKWAFDASFIRYAMEGGAQSIMGFNRGKLDCSVIYCHFANPKIFLRQLGMEEERILLDIVVLVLHFIVFKVAIYLGLVYKIGGKKLLETNQN